MSDDLVYALDAAGKMVKLPAGQLDNAINAKQISRAASKEEIASFSSGDAAPAPTETDQVYALDPSGKMVKLPASQLQAAVNQGAIARAATRREIEDFQHTSSLTDDLGEKLQAAGEGVVSSVTWGLPDVLSREELSHSEREAYAARANSPWGQAFRIGTDVATAVASGGTSLLRKGLQEGAEAGAKQLAKGSVKETVQRGTQQVARAVSEAAQHTPTGVLTRGAAEAGEATARKLEQLGINEYIAKSAGTVAEGITDGAVMAARDKISEAGLGDEDLNAEKLLFAMGHGGLFGAAAGAVFSSPGLARKGFDESTLALAKRADRAITKSGEAVKKAAHVVPDIGKAVDRSKLDMAADGTAWLASKISGEDKALIKRAIMDPEVRASYIDGPELRKGFSEELGKSFKRINTEEVDSLLTGINVSADSIRPLIRTDAHTQIAANAVASLLETGGQIRSAQALAKSIRGAVAKQDSAAAFEAIAQAHNAALKQGNSDLAVQLRTVLADEDTWGAAAKPVVQQAKAVAALGNSKVGWDDIIGADDPVAAVSRYLDTIDPSNPTRSAGYVQLSRYLDARATAIKTVAESGSLPSGGVAALKSELDAVREASQALQVATEKIGGSKVLDALIANERDSVLESVIPAVAAMTAGPTGMLAAGAYMSLKNPGSTLKKITYIESQARQLLAVDGRVHKIVKQHIARLSNAQGMARRAFSDTMSARSKRGATVNALPMVIRAYGHDEKTRRKKVEQDIKNLERLSQNPMASIRMASSMTRGMSDVAPRTTMSVAAKHIAMVDYLKGKIPPRPPLNPMQPSRKIPLTNAQVTSLARTFIAAKEPFSVLRDLESGSLTSEGVDVLKSIYPKLYNELRVVAATELAKVKDPIPFNAAVQLSILLDLPGHPALNPEFLARQAERWAARADSEKAQPPDRPSQAAPDLAENSATLSDKIVQNL